MSEQFDCTVRLRRLHGMRGYGVYCRIAELTASSPTRKIQYDVDDLAYDMREDAAFIRQVVENFGLFVVEDGWLEDAFNRSPEAKERERREQIKRNRSEGARKAAATRRAQKEANANVQTNVQTPSQSVEPTQAPGEANGEDPELARETERFNRIRDEWNKRFRRSRRAVTTLTPDQVTWRNFKESSAVYSDDDYCDAFDQAGKDQKFSWQFKDVLKASNMQRLLSAFEMAQRKKREEEIELTPEQEELIQYANEHGLNWDMID